MIKIRNLWKWYGETIVLERISTDVEEGEFVTLVGASGCGKSTFLNMLLGIVSHDRGWFLLDDKPVPSEPGSDRGIVFQQYSVFPHMTVLENVIAAPGFEKKGLSGYLFGSSYKSARKESLAILKEVGLDHAVDKFPHELSGGMRQRLAIAQALLGKPRILLLDEPFGALDPGIRADMHQLVLRIWKQHKLTIFMVTHDLQEAFYLGTRLWVFDKIRHDPHSPNAYGATITYDLPVGEEQTQVLEDINDDISRTERVENDMIASVN